MIFRALLSTLVLLTSTALSGCGDHDHEEHHGPAEEACEHTKEGPFQDVTATAAADGAPSATFEHTAVRITLVAEGNDNTQNVGYVTYQADEAAEFAFFLSAEVPMEITDANGAAVEIEESADVAECGEVAKQHNADLEVGTYTLKIGPTTETTVSLVVEEASHEGEDH